jgi:hypothetical protein
MDQIIIVMKNGFDDMYFNLQAKFKLEAILKSKKMFDKKND